MAKNIQADAKLLNGIIYYYHETLVKASLFIDLDLYRSKITKPITSIENVLWRWRLSWQHKTHIEKNCLLFVSTHNMKQQIYRMLSVFVYEIFIFIKNTYFIVLTRNNKINHMLFFFALNDGFWSQNFNFSQPSMV